MKHILLILSGLLWLTACRQSSGKKDNPHVVSNGNSISYHIAGTSDTTLMFIHGWCINSSYWSGQANYFSPRYKVVTIDLPGFGASGKVMDSSRSFAVYSEDVRAVIDGLQLSNVILIGHSMSGDIILDMSRRFPEKIIGIIGVDNLHQPGDPFPDTVKKQVTDFFDLFNIQYDSIVNAVMAKDLFQPSTDTSVRKRVLNDVLSANRRIAVNVLRANTMMAQYQKPAMKELNHKLYLVNSDVYPVNADSLQKYCAKGFRVETVHASGHYPMIEMPGEFNNALEKVLTDISKGRK